MGRMESWEFRLLQFLLFSDAGSSIMGQMFMFWMC